jgi:hypothetical protein
MDVNFNRRGIEVKMYWEEDGVNNMVIVVGMRRVKGKVSDLPPRVNISATGDLPTEHIKQFYQAVELAQKYADGEDITGLIDRATLCL